MSLHGKSDHFCACQQIGECCGGKKAFEERFLNQKEQNRVFLTCVGNVSYQLKLRIKAEF